MPWKLQLKTYRFQAERSPKERHSRLRLKELRKVKIHTIAEGESLWTIAQKYGVSMEGLLRWNDLEDPDKIRVGDNLRVKPPVEEAIANKMIATYRVQPGDTLYAISRRHDMTVDEIMELNDMKSSALDVGEELRVYQE